MQVAASIEVMAGSFNIGGNRLLSDGLPAK